MWRRSFLVFLFLASVAAADPNVSAPPKQGAPKSKKKLKEGTYYNYGQVGVKKMEVNGSTINLTFHPTQEQFHWCPGINVEKVPVGDTKQKVTVVTFVRTKTSQSASVDKQARIGKRLIRTVSFDSHGLDVFVREGKKFRRIYESPAKNSTPSPTKKRGKKSEAKDAGGEGGKKPAIGRPAMTLFPSKSHGINGRVPNYHYRKAN